MRLLNKTSHVLAVLGTLAAGGCAKVNPGSVAQSAESTGPRKIQPQFLVCDAGNSLPANGISPEGGSKADLDNFLCRDPDKRGASDLKPNPNVALADDKVDPCNNVSFSTNPLYNFPAGTMLKSARELAEHLKKHPLQFQFVRKYRDDEGKPLPAVELTASVSNVLGYEGGDGNILKVQGRVIGPDTAAEKNSYDSYQVDLVGAKDEKSSLGYYIKEVKLSLVDPKHNNTPLNSVVAACEAPKSAEEIQKLASAQQQTGEELSKNFNETCEKQEPKAELNVKWPLGTLMKAYFKGVLQNGTFSQVQGRIVFELISSQSGGKVVQTKEVPMTEAILKDEVVLQSFNVSKASAYSVHAYYTNFLNAKNYETSSSDVAVNPDDISKCTLKAASEGLIELQSK